MRPPPVRFPRRGKSVSRSTWLSENPSSRPSSLPGMRSDGFQVTAANSSRATDSVPSRLDGSWNSQTCLPDLPMTPNGRPPRVRRCRMHRSQSWAPRREAATCSQYRAGPAARRRTRLPLQRIVAPARSRHSGPLSRPFHEPNSHGWSLSLPTFRIQCAGASPSRTAFRSSPCGVVAVSSGKSRSRHAALSCNRPPTVSPGRVAAISVPPPRTQASMAPAAPGSSTGDSASTRLDTVASGRRSPIAV